MTVAVQGGAGTVLEFENVRLLRHIELYKSEVELLKEANVMNIENNWSDRASWMARSVDTKVAIATETHEQELKESMEYSVQLANDLRTARDKALSAHENQRQLELERKQWQLNKWQLNAETETLKAKLAQALEGAAEHDNVLGQLRQQLKEAETNQAKLASELQVASDDADTCKTALGEAVDQMAAQDKILQDLKQVRATETQFMGEM